MYAWRFHQWHGYVARMTAPAITGGAECKLQRPQWQPGQPPRRRIRFCYCTIIIIIEWHNTLTYICVDELCQHWFRQRLVAWTAPSQYLIPCWNPSAAECRPFCLWANEIRYQYVYYRQKLGIYIYIYNRLSVYIKRGGGGGLSLWRLHGTTGPWRHVITWQDSAVCFT